MPLTGLESKNKVANTHLYFKYANRYMSKLGYVVVDTNLVLSALIFTNGKLNKLRLGWQNGIFQPVISTATAAELIKVLTYPKFKLTQEDQHTLLADYLPYCVTIDIPKNLNLLIECRDPFDLPFLTLASAAKAKHLVSGDQDLLVLAGQFDFSIVSAEVFMQCW